MAVSHAVVMMGASDAAAVVAAMAAQAVKIQ
jgi:hypothetical protein